MADDTFFGNADESDQTIIRPAISKRRIDPSASVESNNNSRDSAGASYLGLDPVESLFAMRSLGINPIIAAASPVLGLSHQLHKTPHLEDINTLHRQLSKEIQDFETFCVTSNVDRKEILIARYLLCALIDEFVLTTPWGNNSFWGHRSLLSTFHKETSGGQKFFAIVERLQADPRTNIQLLELCSLCLLFGFKGKFRIDPDGDQKLTLLVTRLQRNVESVRGKPASRISTQWQGEMTVSQKERKGIPIWIVLSFTCAILAIVYSGFNYALNSYAEPVLADINRIAIESIESGK